MQEHTVLLVYCTAPAWCHPQSSKFVYLLWCLLLFLILVQIIVIIVNNCDAHFYLCRLDPPTHDSGPHSEDPHLFFCENSEFIHSFIQAPPHDLSPHNVPPLFSMGHNFRYWNTEILNITSHLGNKKDFILQFMDYKWQRSHCIVCRITTYIHSGVFLILQIWNGKILPDIKAFPACDIFYLLYLIILFMKFLVVAGLKRLIMCINIFFYHSVIFSLFIHQTFKKNLFLYLSLLANLKKPECLILCIFPAEITS